MSGLGAPGEQGFKNKISSLEGIGCSSRGGENEMDKGGREQRDLDWGGLRLI